MGFEFYLLAPLMTGAFRSPPRPPSVRGCLGVPLPGIHSKVWIDGGGKGTVRTQTVPVSSLGRHR